MPDYTHRNRDFAFSSPLGEDVLLLQRLEGRERMSGLSEYTLDLLSEDHRIAGPDLIAKFVTASFDSAAGHTRHVSGVVRSLEHLGRNDRLSRYRVSVVPEVWRLTQNADSRIFQNKSIPQIVSEVLEGAAVGDFEQTLSGTYPELEYVVQYGESDWHFVARLLERAGIGYFFRHSESGHTLVMFDGPDAHAPVEDEAVRFIGRVGGLTGGGELLSWSRRTEFRPGQMANADYNFQTPWADMNSGVGTKMKTAATRAAEVFEFPGGYEDAAAGKSVATLRQEAEEAAHEVVRGGSHCRSFCPGGTFTVAEHSDYKEEGQSYVLTSVSHQFDAGDTFLTGGETGRAYENTFEAIPARTPYRPPRETPRPRVYGSQTAVVVGPDNEEIHTDEHGRVKVQFHWDRYGRKNEHSSCWMRVSQPHAGGNWGYIDIPRIDEEVVVSFLEGDPDRPYVSGRVYNGSNRPPFDLPAEKTRRGWKTQTYRGEGYNELSMNDAPDGQEMRLHAEKDMNSVVKNDQTLKVGNNQTEDVAADRTRTVGGRETVTVEGDVAETYNGHQKTDVADTLKLTAGTSITLQCGASMLHMNQAGVITLSGTMINIMAAINANVAAPITNVVGAVLSSNSSMGWNVRSGRNVSTSASKTLDETAGGDMTQTVGGGFKLTSAGDAITTAGGHAGVSATGSIGIVSAANASIRASGSSAIVAGAETLVQGGVVRLN